MHGSQGGVSLIFGGAATTYPMLLRAATALDLCIWCHEANSGGLSPAPPDVINNTLGYIASAGDFRNRNVAHDLNRHDLERTGMDSVSPPGLSGATWTDVTDKFGTTFNCLYCHEQHGNKNYRNLRYHPSNPAEDSIGGTGAVTVNFSVDGGSSCSDAGTTPCDVEITLGGPNWSQYSRTTNYIEFFKNGDSDYNRLSEWCGKCHTDFYGISGASNMGGITGSGVGAGDDNSTTSSPWLRHPVGDINITLADTNMHADASFWDATANDVEVRFADQTGAADDEQPFCLSCHYAHGGGNPNNATNPNLDHSMLVFTDDQDSDLSTPGLVNIDSSYQTASGKLSNTCQQCHNQ
jgi:cytochrome c553